MEKVIHKRLVVILSALMSQNRHARFIEKTARLYNRWEECCHSEGSHKFEEETTQLHTVL